MKRILHRRRSSAGNNDAHVTLSLHKDDFHNLTATDPGVPPQKTGTLLKFTNVIKGWKARTFTLENGRLVYFDAESEDGDSPASSSRNLFEKERSKKKRSKLRKFKRAFSREDKERDVKGSINLQTAVITPDESDSCRFAIDVGHDVYHCKAETREERDDWVQVLNASNAYFRGLIQRAISRSQQPVSPPESPQGKLLRSKQSGKAASPPLKPVATSPLIPQISDDSEESVLEDDGLKEAEQSRRALMNELQRVLDVWKKELLSSDSPQLGSEELLRILAYTFRDLGTKDQAVTGDHVREATKGLIDLTSWCLNVLQTNDEMFDRRLKADLTRLMANQLPVFPKTMVPRAPQDSQKISDESSDDEFVDALSRVASLRSSARLSGLPISSFVPITEPPLKVIDEVEIPEEDKIVEHVGPVRRVDTQILSRAVKGDRTSLPPLPPNTERPNVLSLLMDSVGKDLSRISFPVSLNEPLSFVQRLAEDIEYCELLDKGASESDPNRRLMYVAAMVISHYSSTLGRIAKPFNPLLGETACIIRPKKGKGVRFIAEQVSHHPPISACYAEGSGASWKYYNAIEVKHKFWGKSLEIIPTGLNHIEFPATGDHYVFSQVTTCVHNIVIGRMWLDNYGQMEIVNTTNGGRCVIDFNKTGWMSDSNSFGAITGTIFDADGVAKIKIKGNWTKSVYEHLGRRKRNVLWQAEERPPETLSQSYNMTKWAITLNAPVHDDERQFVAPTDSRLRPDQRALENGMFEEAANLKTALEESQRNRRRKMDEAGVPFEPQWFRKVVDEKTGATDYRYGGEYFEKHSKGDWSRCTDIFAVDGAGL
ncbi:Oxysterol-binding protein [Gracilaria domingensis]|nr:Oxysterol-binding protein [Gracilaria domingensis]